MPIVDLASFDNAEGVCWVRWSFDLGPDVVWEGLTDPIWLRRWLGTPTGAFGAGTPAGLGDVVTIDHGDGQLQTSRVRACVAAEMLEVSWEFTGEATSLLEVRLTPGAGGGTDLTLTHTGLGSGARDYAIGWHTHLIYLAAALRASPMDLAQYFDVYERVARAYFAR